MRTRTLVVGMLLLLSAAVLLTAQSNEDVLWQCAKDRNSDMVVAIRCYEGLVTKFATNPSVLVDAHLALGHLYESSSNTAKAKQHYQSVKTTSDNPTKVGEANARLQLLAREPKDPYPRTQIQTPTTDDPFSFAVSPDGLSVVYQAHIDGKGRLVLWRDGKTRSIPGTENAREWAMPFWSPDGRNIGFFAEQKLKTIPVEGGVARTLTSVTSPRGGTWGPNDVIIFAREGGPIYRISAVDGTLAEAAPAGSTYNVNRFPRFLTDGRSFLYWKYNPPGTLTTTLAALGTDVQKPLRSGPGAAQVSQNHLYFVVGQLWNVPSGALAAQPLDPQSLELSGSVVSLGEQVALHPGFPGLAALSTSLMGAIALRSDASVNRQFVWMDRTGHQEGDLGLPDRNSPCCMRFSSDGATMAYFRLINHGIGSIWMMDAEAGTHFQFRNATRTIAFSPDGQQFAWSGLPEDRSVFSTMQIRPVSAFKGATAVLGVAQESRNVTDESDNGYVLYTRANKETGIDVFAMSVKGTEPIPVATGPADERNGRFSPDARWVVYVSDETGSDQIYVQPFSPVSDARLKVSVNGGTIPQWSRDGRQIYFLSADDHVMVADVTAGAEIEIGTPRPLFPKALRHGSTFEMTPDSQRLLVITPVEDLAPIILLPNGPKRPSP